MMKRISIRNNLTLTLIRIVLLPLLAIGVALSIYTYGVEKEDILEYQESTTALAAQNISLYLHYEEQRIHTFLRVNHIMGMSVKEQSNALLLFLLSSGDPDYRHTFGNITLLNNKGKVLVSHSLGGTGVVPKTPDMAKANEFLIPLYIEKVYYSPAHFDETAAIPVMRIAVPVMDIRTRMFQGVLILEMNLMSMEEWISDIGVGKNEIVYLVNSAGRVLVHSDPTVVYGNTNIKLPKRAAVTKSTNGRKVFLSARKILFDGYGQPLSVVIESPVREVYGHMYRSMLLLGIISILSLAGIVIFGLTAIRRFVLPIESLARTANKINSGNTKQKAKSRNVKELNDIAQAYNVTTARLTGTIDALEDEKNLLFSAINALSYPFYIINVKDYAIKHANSAARLGFFSEDSKCYSLLNGFDKPCCEKDNLCTIKEILRTGKNVVLQNVVKRADGTKGIYEIHGHPRFDNMGEIIQIIVNIIDITEKKRIEEYTGIQADQLIQADKLASLGVLVAGVAHEINNPNQSILNNSLLLKDSWGSIKTVLNKYYNERGDFLIGGMDYLEFREIAGTCFDGISISARKISSIVSELKIFSRQDQREIHTEVDINKVIKTSLKLLSSKIKVKMIEITMVLSPVLPSLKGNPIRLEQVIVNLLDNACQALTGDGNKISISSFCSDNMDRVIIEIRDNGIGISPENIRKIKDPLFTTRLNTGGTGLGLSVSGTIIEEHDGLLEFESSPGEGTIARIILPVKVHDRKGVMDT